MESSSPFSVTKENRSKTEQRGFLHILNTCSFLTLMSMQPGKKQISAFKVSWYTDLIDEAKMELPSPCNWVWKKKSEGYYKQFWTYLPDASQSSYDLTTLHL